MTQAGFSLPIQQVIGSRPSEPFTSPILAVVLPVFRFTHCRIVIIAPLE